MTAQPCLRDGDPDAGVRRVPRWRRWLKWLLCTVAGLIGLILLLAAFWVWSLRTGRLTRWFATWTARSAEKAAPQEVRWPPAGKEPPDAWVGPRLSAVGVTTREAFYNPTNLWPVHLRFTRAQWDALEPGLVSPVFTFDAPDGKIPLLNTNATRNGLAGSMGFEFPWSQAVVEVGGLTFAEAGVRFKGNGTFLGAYTTFKKPYKIDLARTRKTQNLAGIGTLNLGNLNADYSCISDSLAYEFFRQSGVPAPRTAYARVLLTVEGRFNHRPLGLYVTVENPDASWAREVFQARHVALFKPVTYDLFQYLGSNWSAYERIYDPKSKLHPADQQRVIDIARLFSLAPKAEFNARVGDLVDLEETARFIAVNALLSCYDGILSTGQNFLLYLDPGSGRAGFIPWDLDRAWGEFPFLGTTEDREKASVMRPWVGRNRFFERLFACERFTTLYRSELERLHRTLFRPDRLSARMDALALVIRPVVQEETEFWRVRFEEALDSRDLPGPRDGNPMDALRPVHQVKRFLRKRDEAVQAQLAGGAPGHVFLNREIGGKTAAAP